MLLDLNVSLAFTLNIKTEFYLFSSSLTIPVFV